MHNKYLLKPLAPYREIVKTTFSPSSGVSDEDIRRIMRVRVSSKQMEPEQQIAAANKVIKRLKETLTDLLRSKNEFIIKATVVEKNARNGWANALDTMQILDDDRYYYKKKLKQMEVDNNIWKDNAKDSMRELSSAEDKNQSLKKEIDEMRKKVQDYEATVTQTRIALEVEKTRVQELEKQYSRQEAMPVNPTAIETIKAQARKDAENELKELLEKDKATLRDDIRHCEARIRSLESQLSLSETQLARAVAETEVSYL
jgi:chromosome segregation ATPase